MNDNPELRKALSQIIAEIKLRNYQIQICEFIIMFMSMHLNKNGIGMNDADKQVMDMFDKIMNSSNFEQAEAHFVGLADKFCNDLGLGDYETLKKNLSSLNENNTNEEGDF